MTHPSVVHLSSKALNERAASAAKTIARSGICLDDKGALAYEAAMKGCAHLGNVEVLEKIAAPYRLPFQCVILSQEVSDEAVVRPIGRRGGGDMPYLEVEVTLGKHVSRFYPVIRELSSVGPGARVLVERSPQWWCRETT